MRSSQNSSSTRLGDKDSIDLILAGQPKPPSIIIAHPMRCPQLSHLCRLPTCSVAQIVQITVPRIRIH
jgi:hypothetical protein